MVVKTAPHPQGHASEAMARGPAVRMGDVVGVTNLLRGRMVPSISFRNQWAAMAKRLAGNRPEGAARVGRPSACMAAVRAAHMAEAKGWD